MRLRGLSAPAIDGDAVVVGDFEGYLHWLDRGNGALLARTRAGGERISNPPLAVNGLLLVQDDGGTVSAYRSRPRG
jgi:outer membrane protein assembly factor BamB